MSRGTAVSLFRDRVRLGGARVAFRSLAAGGEERDVVFSWQAWGDASRAVAAALVADGHPHGGVAAVLAGSRPVWPIADLGILQAGMVSTGIYPTSAPAQVAQVLGDSGASVVFVDTPDQRDKVLSVADRLPGLRTVVLGDGSPGSGAEAGERGAFAQTRPAVVGWDAWAGRGRAALRAGADRDLDARGGRIEPDDVAVLIYTSGSTGVPKGARITHRTLLASAASVRDALGLRATDSALSFLPYCHAAERIFGLYTRILCGMEAGLVPDANRVWDAARAFRPTLFGGLPRFYEKVFEALQVHRAAASGAERARWQRVLEMGRLRSRLLRTGAAVPAGHEEVWRREGEPLFARVRDHFGGRVRLATSGGAALPMEVAEFLDALGLPVLGAYGLTEHLCVAFNRPARYAFDGVGPPMDGTEIRIAGDGEILVRRGALTFSGYHGKPAETRDAFTPDGEWLLTGDLGSLDSQGILHVTGRKKELIALSTGKKVAPLPIESRLLEDPWISHAMLYGEGRKFLSALICLRRSVVEEWARASGEAAASDFESLLRRPEVSARVQAAVDRVNANLSRTEQIRRQVLLDHELSLEADELTPTLKLRRGVIAERYRDLLDALYR